MTLALTAFVDASTKDVRSLFVPFGDMTNGNETYPGGRYLVVLNMAEARLVCDWIEGRGGADSGGRVGYHGAQRNIAVPGIAAPRSATGRPRGARSGRRTSVPRWRDFRFPSRRSWTRS